MVKVHVGAGKSVGHTNRKIPPQQEKMWVFYLSDRERDASARADGHKSRSNSTTWITYSWNYIFPIFERMLRVVHAAIFSSNRKVRTWDVYEFHLRFHWLPPLLDCSFCSYRLWGVNKNYWIVMPTIEINNLLIQRKQLVIYLFTIKSRVINVCIGTKQDAGRMYFWYHWRVQIARFWEKFP